MPFPTRMLLAAMLAICATPAMAQRWATVWAGSDQGPYPAGNASAQPDLSFTFPHPESGSHEQSFRLIIKPDLWARQMRFRFSNAFGTKPVSFDTAFVGLQMSGAALVAGTNRPLTFAGKKTVTVAPGAQVWSDAVGLPFVRNPAASELAGRKLAVTFHIPGDSGPMTWHAKAMTTSYVTAPDAGAIGELEDDSAYPASTTSWYFLDAADAIVPSDTRVVLCFGDSITDGTASTLNGDDRWTDVLSRRLHATGGHVAVVDAGIGGNQVAGPPEYTAAKPFSGGPSAISRLDRDLLTLSGVTDVIWFEGINDLGAANAVPDNVANTVRAGVERIRAKIKGVRVFGATLTSSRASTAPGYGTADTDNRRHALNDLIRKPGLFDAVIDFDGVTVDRQTGELRAEFVPPSTAGGTGDKLHPNRAGYLAMGNAVELRLIVPVEVVRPRPRPRPRSAASADAAADPAEIIPQ
ncbi:GDSL-type esterase/lipase family protein [Acidisphaera sp. L21]|uniref:GDSL-type esterase/lipase family protein n=1 Tax=Acidisphaera sp. L21 TaxID=1641851 RepID=UPI00131E81C7|nr:GDSL-type esterase/lipase family protein [Acidisphaera sp. L21]